MEILSGLSRWHAIGFGASCLLHAGLIAGVLITERWIHAGLLRPPVLLAELVTATPDAPLPEPPIKKPVPKPAPRLLSHLPLPRLPFTRPASAPPAAPPPPAPSPPTVSEPPPASSTPAAPSAAAPSSTSAVTTPSAAATTTESASWPASPPSTNVASVASGEAAAGPITRSARPQGGYQVRPSYPSSALRQGIQGTTLLKVHVQVDGRVGDVLVQQTAGHPDLDQAAVEAVRRWRFEPARRGSDPVAMWVLLPVEFQIR